MKLAKVLKTLGGLFFLLVWIPFAMIFVTGYFSENIGSSPASQDGGLFWTMTPWIILTISFGVATAFCFIASLLVGGLSNLTIMAKGLDAEATILAITDTGSSVNDNPIIDFSLEVRPRNSAPFAAVARKTVSLIDLPSVQPGKTVRVKYVPGKEQVAIVDARDLELLKSKGLIKDDQ